MTQVPVQVPETTHTGNGYTVSFLIGFVLASGSTLRVTVDGVPKTSGVDYSIVGTSVVFVTAPALGAAIAWRGVTPIRQNREFPTQPTMKPLSVEAALNERAIVDQEQEARLDRGVSAPIGEPGMELPAAAARLDRIYVGGGAGQPLKLLEGSEQVVTLNAAGEAVPMDLIHVFGAIGTDLFDDGFWELSDNPSSNDDGVFG